MTVFDYYVIGFIPVAIVLILIELIANDWDIEKMIWEEEK